MQTIMLIKGPPKNLKYPLYDEGYKKKLDI